MSRIMRVAIGAAGVFALIALSFLAGLAITEAKRPLFHRPSIVPCLPVYRGKAPIHDASGEFYIDEGAQFYVLLILPVSVREPGRIRRVGDGSTVALRAGSPHERTGSAERNCLLVFGEESELRICVDAQFIARFYDASQTPDTDSRFFPITTEAIASALEERSAIRYREFLESQGVELQGSDAQ